MLPKQRISPPYSHARPWQQGVGTSKRFGGSLFDTASRGEHQAKPILTQPLQPQVLGYCTHLIELGGAGASGAVSHKKQKKSLLCSKANTMVLVGDEPGRHQEASSPQ